MIDFYKQNKFVRSVDISKSTALAIIKILSNDTGVPWTFRKTPYLNQKRT